MEVEDLVPNKAELTSKPTVQPVRRSLGGGGSGWLLGCSGGALLRALIHDLVLLHLAVERRAIESQDLRRLLLVPVRALQRLQDGHLLDFRQRAMRRDGELLRRP